MLQNEYINYKDKSSEKYAGKNQFQNITYWMIFLVNQSFKNNNNKTHSLAYQ